MATVNELPDMVTVLVNKMLPKATVITNELPDTITVMANEMQPQVIDVQLTTRHGHCDDQLTTRQWSL